MLMLMGMLLLDVNGATEVKVLLSRVDATFNSKFNVTLGINKPLTFCLSELLRTSVRSNGLDLSWAKVVPNSDGSIISLSVAKLVCPCLEDFHVQSSVTSRILFMEGWVSA